MLRSLSRVPQLGAFCALFGLLASAPLPAQQAAAPGLTQPPRAWIADAAANEAGIVDHRSISLRYLSHRIDAKGDTVRDTIDTPQGAVARLVQLSGHPLTPDQDKAERDRLESVLKSPSDFARHHHRDDEDRKYTLELVRLMPDAMLYSYADGQPQPAGATGPQVVIDFKPNPAFHPPSTAAELLTGLQGRIWIDVRARRLTRIEAHVVKRINLGWGGILAKVYPGGTLIFEQTDAGNGVWVYSHLEQKITVLELLVKTQKMQLQVTGSRFESFPAINWQEAIHRLLDTPLPN